MAAVERPLDGLLVGGLDGLHQPRMDILPRSFSFASWPDVIGNGVATKLLRPLPEYQPVRAGPITGCGLLARWRWFWMPAVYALALLFVLMITLTQEGGTGQLMYRSF